MHMVIALMVLYFARRWTTGLVLGLLFVAFTITATLGFGEHYVIDLLAAIPYTALMIYLGGSEKPNDKGWSTVNESLIHRPRHPLRQSRLLISPPI